MQQAVNININLKTLKWVIGGSAPAADVEGSRLRTVLSGRAQAAAIIKHAVGQQTPQGKARGRLDNAFGIPGSNVAQFKRNTSHF